MKLIQIIASVLITILLAVGIFFIVQQSAIEGKTPQLVVKGLGSIGTLSYTIGEYNIQSQWKTPSSSGTVMYFEDEQCDYGYGASKTIPGMEINGCPAVPKLIDCRTTNPVGNTCNRSDPNTWCFYRWWSDEQPPIKSCYGGINSKNYGDGDIKYWTYARFTPIEMPKIAGISIKKTYYDTGCVWNYLIKRDGITVGQFPSVGVGDYGFNSVYLTETYADDILHLSESYAYDGINGKYTCTNFENYLKYDPIGNIEMGVLEPDRLDLIEDTPYGIIIEVNNSMLMNLKARLDITYKTGETSFFGQKTKIISKNITIFKGNNHYTINIPTSEIMTELFVSANIEYFMSPEIAQTSPNVFVKVGYDYVPFNEYGDFSIGTYTTEEYSFRVITKPLWTELTNQNTCPIGYEKSPNEKYCIRNDLKELSCMQMGCPTLEGHDYVCTSAGICAEVIYIYKDCTTEGCPEMEGDDITSECLSNGVCRYIQNDVIIQEKKLTCVDNPEWCGTGFNCDITTQVCMENKIIYEIGECSTTSDCYVPCDGMSVECIIPVFADTGYCSYLGECMPQKIDCRTIGCLSGYECVKGERSEPEYYACEKTIIIQKDCKELGCPIGFTCDLDTGACKYTEYISKDCRIDGCIEGYTCDADEGICIEDRKNYLMIGLISGLILIIITLITILIIRKK